jgi:Icc-related predicted phosphoesterase
MTTMISVPVLYVHGNHDDQYEQCPPEGCICIEDQIYNFNGVRILGLGGSQRYKEGTHQYTEREMEKRVRKLSWKLYRSKGFDILVTHSPAQGLHDGKDLCHRGFAVFNRLIERYQPSYFVHGHVHMNYGRQFTREDQVGRTRVINAYERCVIEI